MFRTETVRARIWTGSNWRADSYQIARVMSGEVRPRSIPTLQSDWNHRRQAGSSRSLISEVLRSSTTLAADSAIRIGADDAHNWVDTSAVVHASLAEGARKDPAVRCECDDQNHICGSQLFASHDVDGRLKHGQS
jgi:hypothetical protein